jgi:hypothetical protein
VIPSASEDALKKESVYNIIFQHPVALVNDLTCRGSLEGATSCCGRRLLVSYVVTFTYRSYISDNVTHQEAGSTT